MTKATISDVVPIQGAVYDKTRPETREAWLEQRRGGITATEIRDWGTGSKRRDIIAFKVTGKMEDLSDNIYVNHGNRREPVIAEWIEGRFGITPCDYVYSHGANSRWLASPDGISLDPFTRELLVGAEAVLSEIKTSKYDLMPGRLDADRVLLEVDQSSKFAQSNYYTQMQWQMLVMNAARTLFVWEQHNGIIDPETGTFTPAGPPEYAWIERDDRLIEVLIEQAEKALAEIDAARVAASAGELPPISELPPEEAALVADLLAARDAEAIAAAKKKAAWEKLQALYVGEGKKDFSIKIPGFANVTVSTSTKMVARVNDEKMRARAPQLVAKYEALRKRYTVSEPESKQALTITASK